MKYLLIALISINLLISKSIAQVLPEFPECDPSVVSWHPHPYTCTMYIICFHGNAIERLCAPTLHFSAIYQNCMFPQLAHCDINYQCPSEDDPNYPVFLPNPDDCSSYFVCFNGGTIPRDCADGFWWDVVYNWCTVPDEVVCDSRVPNNPRPPPTTDPEPPVTTTEPPMTIDPTEPTQDPNTYNCPLGDGTSFHPHSRDCSLYFICINGVAFLRQCADRLWFDIIYRECQDMELATCISGTVGNPITNLVDIDAFTFSCPLQAAGEIAFYPHNSKCYRYYRCEQGLAYLHTCPEEQHYDIYTEKCQSKNEAVCLNDL